VHGVHGHQLNGVHEVHGVHGHQLNQSWRQSHVQSADGMIAVYLLAEPKHAVCTTYPVMQADTRRVNRVSRAMHHKQNMESV
jgi:hypothetical protein